MTRVGDGPHAHIETASGGTFQHHAGFDYAATLADVVQALAVRDDAKATRLITEIAYTVTTPKGRTGVSDRLAARIYDRDFYQCRYCGAKTINGIVLRLISRRFPQQFPYDNHSWTSKTHPAVLYRSATIDHIVPTARGGTHDECNLVCACWTCNSKKGILTVAELGWQLRDPADTSWQGLTEYLELLAAFAPAQLSTRDRLWIRLYRRSGPAAYMTDPTTDAQ